MARWLSWLERRPVTAEVVGSNPIRVAKKRKETDARRSKAVSTLSQPLLFLSKRNGILAQLGEHLPYKQGVTGSSPVGPTKCRKALWNTFPKMIASQKKTMFSSGTQSKINTPMWLNSGLLTLSIRGEQSREAWLCQLSRKVDKK